jgi:GH15 family glucan-1,4-alpha-glucosidase
MIIVAENGLKCCSQNLVYRYDVKKSDDGVGGEEGTFCLCTLWCARLTNDVGYA